MPWQRMVADAACEYDPETGIPYYNEVVVTVPRQSGKTTLFLAWQIHRCVSTRWAHPQRSVFTAQTGKDARDKWLDELFPLIRNSELVPLIARRGSRPQINEGMGNESITFKTGSLIRLLSTSASSGHSKTLDQAVMDEVWHDIDDRREQGLRPAMITRPDRQLLICSTAGTAASTVYNRKVRAGQAAVAKDAGRGMAYFEWSAPDGWVLDDEESWWMFMPALGHTIGPDAIRAELPPSLEPAEFRRAYGNVSTPGKDMIVPAEVWQRVHHPERTADVKPAGDLRFGLDVAEDRGSAAISVFGGGTFELLEHGQGIGWAVGRCNELTDRHGARVAIDYGGPAGVLADNLNNCDRLQGREVVQLCGSVYDAIVEDRVKFRWDQLFDDAIEGAVKKEVGDNWVWSRKASAADVTPLMSATVAYSHGAEQKSKPFVIAS